MCSNYETVTEEDRLRRYFDVERGTRTTPATVWPQLLQEENMKAYLYVSVSVFTLVALIHLLRLIQGWQVQVGEHAIPMGASWAYMVIAGALALWGMRTARAAAA